jgi:hypothetical protein
MNKFSLILLVLAMIIVVPACKKNDDLEFNIVGTWDFSMISEDWSGNYIITYSGSETAGNWTLDMGGGDKIFGTYLVEGGDVEMTISYANFENGVVGTYSGKFQSAGKMAGDFAVGDETPDSIGTWSADKK